MAVLGGLISLNRWGYSVDQAIYDTSIAQSRKPIANDILIVAIDERSLLELGRWPWSRDVHADLVNKLDSAGVKAIAFDIVFAEPDRTNPEHDLHFAQAIETMGRVALLVHMEQTHAGGQILEVLPASPLIESAAALGHVHIEYDVDGVCRAVFLKEGLGEAYWPHLMYSLWQITEPNLPEQLPGLTQDAIDNASPFVIQRNYYNLIPLASTTSQVASASYTDIIHGRIPNRSLANKIVIVGATAKGLGDIVATPAGPMPGVEFNANVFNALRNQSTIVPVSDGVHALVSVIAIFALIMLGLRATPRQYLLLTVSGVVSTLLASVAVLIWAQLWFAPLAIIIPVLLFYPLWSWRRLEQALRFLRRELARVQQQSNPTAAYSLEELQRRLQFLATLIAVDHWQITRLDSAAAHTSQVNRSENPANNNPSKVCFLREQGGFKAFSVTWQWPQAVTDGQQQLWLNALATLDGHSIRPEKDVPTELVTATIERLRDANQRADEARAFFDQCLENLQDAVVVADLFGGVRFANARARATFAISAGTGESLMHCLDRLQIDEGWPEVLKKILRQPGEMYAEVQSKNGEQQYFMQLAALHWQSGNIDALVFSFTDISFIKESERARNEALHFLSHDLRSPVVSILALIEHYRVEKGDLSDSGPELNNMLSEIESYARKNLSFAESFLQLARAEIVGDTNFDYCDMHSVIDNALMLIRHQAAAKQINVDVKRSLDDLWVWGDGELLERAVVNLLSNAVKYSNEQTHINLSVKNSDDTVFIAIQDEGIGISQSDQVDIFKRFKRINGKSGISGAGLGLHFVDTVCKKHGGRIELSSELGQGSEFTMKLPLCNEQLAEPE